MRTLGIIAEYNPLHSGHRYHFEESMRQAQASHALVVMSGNFVQRGEPAITDKFSRAEQAIHMGADLVIELPFIYAVSSADYFAAGAIRLLHESGVVDVVSFGSESADLKQLESAAQKLSDPYLKDALRTLMKNGVSYASAVEQYLEHALRAPNDILGVQYLKALRQLQSPIQTILIRRRGHYHDEELAVDFPSARAIRQAHRTGQLGEIDSPIFIEQLNQAIFSLLLTHDLSDINGMSEGIEHKLYKQAKMTHTLDALIESVRTPRFTQARVRRLLIHALAHYTKRDQEALKDEFYFRVLAYNEKGRALLKAIKQRHPERLIYKIPSFSKDPSLQRALHFDIVSSNLYYHLLQSAPEELRKPIHIKKD